MARRLAVATLSPWHRREPAAVVVPLGIEPRASSVSRKRSDLLSYGTGWRWNIRGWERPARFELATPCLEGTCSDQAELRPQGGAVARRMLVEPMGVEPTTSAMPWQRSSQLSYGPVVATWRQPMVPRRGVWWCAREDSNLHDLAVTSPSSWRVCQFRHERVWGGSATAVAGPLPKAPEAGRPGGLAGLRTGAPDASPLRCLTALPVEGGPTRAGVIVLDPFRGQGPRG